MLYCDMTRTQSPYLGLLKPISRWYLNKLIILATYHWSTAVWLHLKISYVLKSYWYYYIAETHSCAADNKPTTMWFCNTTFCIWYFSLLTRVRACFVWFKVWLCTLYLIHQGYIKIKKIPHLHEFKILSYSLLFSYNHTIIFHRLYGLNLVS